MANPQLVQFIQDNLRKGYDINSIKQHLMQYGYRYEDIEQAAQQSLGQGGTQKIEHNIAFSASTMLVIALIVAGLGTGGFLIYKISSPSAPAPSQLLDLRIEPDTVTVVQGGSLFFMRALSNYGSDTRYDIKITYRVRDETTGQIVASEHETIGLETIQNQKYELKMPSSLLPGDYYLEADALYQGRRADAGFRFAIIAKPSTESCTDGLKNQNEEGVDCGGVCKPCATCFDGITNQDEEGVDCGGVCNACTITPPTTPVDPSTKCDDYDICTRDSFQGGNCVFTPIVPCCGNMVCEDGETKSNCNNDCKTGLVTEPVDANEAISQAKAVSKQDPNKAGQICNSIESSAKKNLCFSEVAEYSGKSTFCTRIDSNTKRDSCYMNFALDGDFTVCDKVVNKYLQRSCESLKQIGAVGG